jgi:hypothetical protein
VARKPPVHRRTQKKAQTGLAKRPQAKTEILTMAEIAQIRRQNGGAVRSRVVQQGEYGHSGTLNIYGRIMRNDYNALFDGKNGITVFDQMDRSDGQVGAAGDIIKLPIRAANWRAIPPKDATQKEKDIAEALHLALFGEGIWPAGEGWDFTLRHLLMRVTMGVGLVEKVLMFDEADGVIRWRRFAPRLPNTIDRFEVWPDGTLKNIIQYVPAPGTGTYEYRTIPAEYALISVREREGDNFFGKSIYRRLYKHWFYKDDAYRIDGIRLDRYGVGVPVAKIDEGHILLEDELDEIELTLQALRSHERAYIIEPPKVTFRIMVPEGGHGGASGLMESVNHHDAMIVRGILATFLSDHAEGLNTNRTRTLADIFLHALKAEAKAVANDLLSQAVRPFCDMNFNMVDARYPEIEVTGIGDLTVEQLSMALAPLVTAGVVTPEDTLEEVVRKVFGLPPMPNGWKRGETKPEPPQIPAPGSNQPGGGRGAAGGGRKANGEPIQADQQPVVVTLNNQLPPPLERNADSAELAAALREFSASLEKQQPKAPPEIPPIVIHIAGSNGKPSIKKTIVSKRDEHGHILETVSTEEEGGASGSQS